VLGTLGTCNQLHQFGQIYKLLSNATVNIIEIVRNFASGGGVRINAGIDQHGLCFILHL
jgi:hypothetical protein